jgi:hypothetical protein
MSNLSGDFLISQETVQVTSLEGGLQCLEALLPFLQMPQN